MKIQTYPGPEDIVLDPSTSKRIIMSCTKRKRKKNLSGRLQYYDTGSSKNAATDYNILDYPLQKLRPHGIFATLIGGKATLYVISHEEEDKILVFEIKDKQLIFKREYSAKDYPKLQGANDLFVLEDGTILFTANKESFTTDIGFANGMVGQIDPANDFKILIDRLRFANGIYVHNGELFVTETYSGRLMRYAFSSGQINMPGDVAAKIKGGDNISLHTSGLVIAGHLNLFRFFCMAFIIK
ncbi:MAG: hypothetical protein IPL46_01825 [Saprospiraceae bacterium]|nr:hypothetical protein [Saprospiraceae bacterium]